MHLSLIMIASNSLARQKDVTQREEEEEAGYRRKGGLTGTSMPGAGVPTGPFGSGMLDERNRRKPEWWCGVPLHRKGIGGQGLVLSSHDRNGESYRRIDEVGKGQSYRAKEDLLLPPAILMGKQSELLKLTGINRFVRGKKRPS